MFAIDTVTGEMRTLQELDRENIESYSVRVSAEDGGSPSNSSVVAVLVTVGDVNDNDPFFIGGAVLSNTSVEVFEVNN